MDRSENPRHISCVIRVDRNRPSRDFSTRLRVDKRVRVGHSSDRVDTIDAVAEPIAGKQAAPLAIAETLSIRRRVVLDLGRRGAHFAPYREGSSSVIPGLSALSSLVASFSSSMNGPHSNSVRMLSSPKKRSRARDA